MIVRDTSIEAYLDLKYLNKKQQVVHDTIRAIEPCTDQQIADSLGWPINRVTPRRGELEKKDIIIDAGKVRGPSGRYAHVWRIKYIPGKQIKLDL